MGLRTITPATATPVSLGDARRHLGLTGQEHDRDVERLLIAAGNLLEKRTGRALLNTVYRLTLPGFPSSSCGIELPRPPLVSIDAFTYFDEDNAEQSLDASDYQRDDRDEVPTWLYPAVNETWPATISGRVDAVKIEYTAGYGETPEDLPPEAVQFCLLIARHWFDNPSAVTTGTITKEVELAADSLARSLGTGFYADA